MDVNDETLMLFADGELDPAQRASVAAAVAADPALARRVAEFRAQRERLVAAFAPQLAEPVPDRLLAVVRGAVLPQRADVADIGERRLAKRLALHIRRRSWAELGAIAASIVVAVLVGLEAVHDDGHNSIRLAAGGLIADRQVAAALSSQLASTEPANAPVHIGISFRNRNGELCRTFVAHGETGIAGFACRDRGAWRIGIAETVRAAGAAPANDAVRMAQAEVPASVMHAVEDQISGEPLDATAERAARDAGWSSPSK